MKLIMLFIIAFCIIQSKTVDNPLDHEISAYQKIQEKNIQIGNI